MELSEQLKSIQTGHICLVICCIFYLIWWSITFNPMKEFPAPPKYALFICTLNAGIWGLVFLIKNLGNLPTVNEKFSTVGIAVAGIAVYVILLYLTGHFLHRQVTTELLLIVGWTVLELCMVSGEYGAAALSMSAALIMTAIIIASAVVSMICYLLYYNMKPIIGFYDGMVPLVLFGVVMTVQVMIIH